MKSWLKSIYLLGSQRLCPNDVWFSSKRDQKIERQRDQGTEKDREKQRRIDKGGERNREIQTQKKKDK